MQCSFHSSIERKMAAERFRRVRQLKPRARLLRSILHLPLQARAQLHLVIADDFHRGNARHLVRERRFRLGDFVDVEFARGHIRERQPRAVTFRCHFRVILVKEADIAFGLPLTTQHNKERAL